MMRKLIKLSILICSFFLVFCNYVAFSQPWTRVLGVPHSYGGKIIRLQDGGYLIAGSSNAYGNLKFNAYIVKTDSMGFWQWQQSIGSNASEDGINVTQTDDGTIYLISGIYNGYEFNVDSGFYLTKLTNSGNVIWTKKFGEQYHQNAYSIVAARNDVVVTGKTDNTSNGTMYDIFISKIDTSGTLLWSKTYGGTGYQSARCIANMNDGGFVIGGVTAVPNSTNNFTSYALRTDANGDTLWTKIPYFYGQQTFNDMGYYGCKPLKGDSLIAFTGYRYTGYINLISATLDFNGNEIDYYLSQDLCDWGHDLEATDDGGFIIAGGYGNFGGYGEAFKFSYGNKLINKSTYLRISGLSYCPAYSLFNGVALASDGGYVFCGSTVLFSSKWTSFRMLIMKTGSDGKSNMYGSELISADDTTSFCKGGSVVLSVSPKYDHYQWFRQDQNQQNIWLENTDTSQIIADSNGYYFCMMLNDQVVVIGSYVKINVAELPDTTIYSTGSLNHCAADDTISIYVRPQLHTSFTWYLNGIPIPGNTNKITPTISGLYKVKVSNICGSLTSSGVYVNTASPPEILIDSTVVHLPYLRGANSSCSFFVYKLTAEPGTNYTWYHNGFPNGCTQAKDTVYQSGLYYVIGQNSCGVGQSNIGYIEYDTLNLSYNMPLTNVCDNKAIIITAPANGYQYLWYKNGNFVANTGSNNLFQPGLLTTSKDSGHYFCEITYHCGNNQITGFTDSVYYVENSLNYYLNIIGSSPSCFGNPIPIQAYPSGGFYNWYLNDTLIASTVSNLFNAYLSGYYRCQIILPCGSVSTSSTYYLVTGPANSTNTQIVFNPPDSAICRSTYDTSTVMFYMPNLNNFGFGQVQWQYNHIDIPGATSPYYTTNIAGWYNAVVTNSCGSFITDSFQIKEQALSFSTNNKVTKKHKCPGFMETLSTGFDSSASYQWFCNSNPIQGATTNIYNASSQGSYYVRINYGKCNTSDSHVNIAVQQPIVNNILAFTPPFICGDSVKLNANERFDYSYQWFKDQSPLFGDTLPFYYASSAENYSVRISDSIGCPYISDPVTVLDSSLEKIPVFINNGFDYCISDSIILFAPSGYTSYQWFVDSNILTGETMNFITPQQSGLYSVSATSGNGCRAVGSYLLNIPGPPVLNQKISYPEVCGLSNGLLILSFNTSIPLRIIINGPGFFYDSQNLPSIIQNNWHDSLKAGWYYFTYSYLEGGCSMSDSIEIKSELPKIKSIDSTGCQGEIIQLNSSFHDFNNLWSNGETTSSIFVSTSGLYTLTVSDSTSGCFGIDSIMITIFPLPLINIAPSGPTSICNSSSITLDAGSGNFQYQWSDGQTTQIINASAGGIYVLTVTDPLTQCINRDTFQLNIKNNPFLSIDTSDTKNICLGNLLIPETFPLNVQYLWSTGSTQQNIYPSVSGTYILTVTDMITGCSSTDSIYVLILNSPLVSVTPGDSISICNGSSTSLHATAGYSNYQWNIGSSDSLIMVNTPGNYQVTVTDSSGCKANDSTEVFILPLPPLSLFALNNFHICPGEYTTLYATAGYPYYLWSNGFTDSSITVNSAGNYFVTISDTLGCTNSDSADVILYPSPVFAISPALQTSFCQGQSVSLNVTGGFLSYFWSNGLTDSIIWINTTGIYYVTVTDIHGCTASDSVTVSDFPPLTHTTSFAIPSCSSCCDGTASVNPLTGTPPFSYLWDNGQTTQTAIGLCNGIYDVMIIDANGCNDSATFSFSTGTGDQFNQTNEIKVFPNPTNNYLHINGELFKNESVFIKLFSILGQRLFEMEYSVSTKNIDKIIDISNYQNGLYILNIKSKSLNYFFKVQKN